MSDPAANLAYLIETVIPFISGMKDRHESNGISDAVLDFDEYIREPTKSETLMGRELTTAHNCGRVGCLAGWYTMLSAQDERLPEEELVSLSSYSEYMLSIHFDISMSESVGLFGGQGGGAEEDLSPDIEATDEDGDYCSGHYSNELILDARCELAAQLLEEKTEALEDEELTT